MLHDIVVDERDNIGHTALHWVVYQRDEVSTQILLKMDASPNAVDLSLHATWAFGLEAGRTTIVGAIWRGMRRSSQGPRPGVCVSCEMGSPSDLWSCSTFCGPVPLGNNHTWRETIELSRRAGDVEH
jgi:hypothetical protein